MLVDLTRLVRQGFVLAVALVPGLASAAPFPPDSLVTVDLPDAAATCRLLPAPMEGACEGLAPDLGAQLSGSLRSIDGVVVRGVALVRRAPAVHMIVVSEYPNVGYVAKVDDLKRLSTEYQHGLPAGASEAAIELRDGGAAVGPYGSIRYGAVTDGQRTSLGFFPFLGNPNIHLVQVTTVGDDATGIAFGNELMATARVSPQYEPRSIAAPVRKDISGLLASVMSYGIIAVIACVALWVGRKNRKVAGNESRR